MLNIDNLLLKPSEYFTDIITKGSNATLGESILARITMIAQLILSIIALPVHFVVGLLTAGFELCKGEHVGPTLAGTKESIRLHALVAIPLSFVGIFTPLETSKTFREYLDNHIY